MTAACHLMPAAVVVMGMIVIAVFVVIMAVRMPLVFMSMAVDRNGGPGQREHLEPAQAAQVVPLEAAQVWRIASLRFEDVQPLLERRDFARFKVPVG